MGLMRLNAVCSLVFFAAAHCSLVFFSTASKVVFTQSVGCGMCLQSKVGRLGIMRGEYSSQKICTGILDLGTQFKTEDGSEYEFTSKLPLHSVATQDKITMKRNQLNILHECHATFPTFESV